MISVILLSLLALTSVKAGPVPPALRADPAPPAPPAPPAAPAPPSPPAPPALPAPLPRGIDIGVFPVSPEVYQLDDPIIEKRQPFHPSISGHIGNSPSNVEGSYADNNGYSSPINVHLGEKKRALVDIYGAGLIADNLRREAGAPRDSVDANAADMGADLCLGVTTNYAGADDCQGPALIAVNPDPQTPTDQPTSSVPTDTEPSSTVSPTTTADAVLYGGPPTETPDPQSNADQTTTTSVSTNSEPSSTVSPTTTVLYTGPPTQTPITQSNTDQSTSSVPTGTEPSSTVSSTVSAEVDMTVSPTPN